MNMYRNIILPLVLLILAFPSNGQDMTIKKMDKILKTVADSVTGEGGIWQFKYNESSMIILTDEKYNRMRIISPIIGLEMLDKPELIRVLEANYHSALDVKYALTDEVLWSVYIHPLKELSENQFINAISQVHKAAVTFGSSYSSTSLLFGVQDLGKKSNPSKKN